jgi:hypothetical protein
MVEVLVGRQALAEAGRAIYALPSMVRTPVRNGRSEQQALVQVELSALGSVRVRALVADPLGARLEAEASEVLATLLEQR